MARTFPVTALGTPKRETQMTAAELQAREDEELSKGPLSVLSQSVKNKTKVLIYCHSNRKLLGRITAFDKNWNMMLEDVVEMWSENLRPGRGKEKAKMVNRERFISEMFLRGDSVILVARNPSGATSNK